MHSKLSIYNSKQLSILYISTILAGCFEFKSRITNAKVTVFNPGRRSGSTKAASGNKPAIGPYSIAGAFFGSFFGDVSRERSESGSKKEHILISIISLPFFLS